MKRRRDERAPWNRMKVKLELYVSPELKLRLGLAQRTTEEALEEQKKNEGKPPDEDE